MMDINHGDGTFKETAYEVLQDNEDDQQLKDPNTPANEPQKEKLRNHIGFWILGLTNNFSYVVMLSAAFDILGGKIGKVKKSESKGYHCNPSSTGVILLADIIPTLVIKWTTPFYMQRISYNLRVASVVLFSLGSFLLVALCKHLPLNILGVVLASISSGFGEITFLSLTSHFQSNTISSWSAGTGAAGVAAALSYAGLTSLGVTPKETILLMIIVPFLMAFAHWGLLAPDESYDAVDETDRASLVRKRLKDATATMCLREKIKLMRPLVQYMVPLLLVYFAEYIINQGLFELLYYPSSTMDHSEQYRWLQFCYQFGVLISRSSVSFIKIEKIELLAALQYVNFIVLLLEVYYRFIPSIWIALGISLFEGLLGGGVYVNAFYRIAIEVQQKYREFSMGAASMADSTGITLAGIASIPLHNYLCKYAKPPI